MRCNSGTKLRSELQRIRTLRAVKCFLMRITVLNIFYILNGSSNSVHFHVKVADVEIGTTVVFVMVQSNSSEQ